MTATVRRLQGRAGHWLDPALATAIVVLGVAEAVTNPPRGGVAPNVVMAAAYGALVLHRRRWPAPVLALGWCVAALTQTLLLATTGEASIGWLSFVLLTFAVGRHAPRREATIAIVLLVLGMEGVYAGSADAVPGDFFWPQAIGVVIWLAGRTLRGRARTTEQLHELAARAQEQAAAEAELAQAAERRRLAQEMHDVIAHSLSLIVVQAGGARRILATDPARATEAATLIERTGREALGELRQLLGVLTPHAQAAPARRSAPTLGELESLVASARDAGLRVDVTRTGDTSPLPAGVDLAGYRIVQEALTNALRHAGPVDAAVAVHQQDGVLRLEVTNAAGQASAASLGSSGHGLVGMTERANLYGGTLDAHPLPGGGFRVAATLRAEREEATA